MSGTPSIGQSGSASSERTSLAAVCSLTFLCSIGTGVVWAGIPFIARQQYDFSKQTTLWLYLTLGATYVLGALSAGIGLRRVEERLSHRGVLAIILIVAAVSSLLLLFTSASWMLWIVAIAINIVMSWLWPIVESYVTAGKHGRDMRNAIGLWNITWTSAVFVSLLLMAPLVESHAKLSLAGTAIVYLLSLVALGWFSSRPLEHGDADELEASVESRREYPQLLRSSRWLLLASYVLNSAMSPLLPFLIARQEVATDSATIVAATWTAARVVVVALMWRAGFWHGRWGTIVIGAAALALGFGMTVGSATLPMLLIGLALLGTGMAIVYYATLYYTMTVGAAEVDASGGFEALIGLGYTAGPAAGLIGLQCTGAIDRSPLRVLGPDAGVIVMAVGVLMVAALLALRPYVTARAMRAST